MPLFSKKERVLYPEPLRCVLIGAYLRSMGRSISVEKQEFFISHNGFKIPTFPIYLPEGDESESIDGISLSILEEGSVGSGSDYIRIAIGEGVRITYYGYDADFEKELQREAPFLIPVWKRAREISEDYYSGNRRSAKKKWEEMRSLIVNMKGKEKDFLRAVFCSPLFITHRFEQNEPEGAHYPFVSHISAVRRVVNPERLSSRLISLYNFERLFSDEKLTLLTPFNQDVQGVRRKCVYIVKGERKLFPSEMDGAVIFYRDPSSEPFYFEALPHLSDDKTLIIAVYAPKDSSPEDLRRALNTLAPLTSETNTEIIKVNDNFNVVVVDSPYAKGTRMLIPPQPSHLARELRDIHTLSLI